MDAASATSCCSVFSSFSVFVNDDKKKSHSIQKRHLCWPLSPLPVSLLRNLNFRLGIPNPDYLVARSSTSTSIDLDYLPSQQIAVLLEVDGVLIDAYRSGNCQAFNVAFQKLGLDCAKWTRPVYLDLLRKAAGDEGKMVILYFNQTGWPTSLPTNEKETFMQSILREKEKALDDLLLSNVLPLRSEVEKFIDEALNEGMPVVFLAASSKLGEKIARATIERLGLERVSKLKIIGKEEIENSLYGRLVLGHGAFSGLDEELASEANKAVAYEKQKIAEEVAAKLKLRVYINTIPAESMKNSVAALRAGAEYANVPVRHCVLVAGTRCGVAAAELIGIPCVVLRNSLISGANFPSAKAVLDGFGGADLTVSKLRRKLR